MAGAVPGTKYLYVTIKDKQGNLKRVAMERSKALALRRKRGIAQTTGLIPKPMRDAVDAGGIYDAVQAHIQSLNTPLDAVKQQAQSQFDTNQRMNAQLGQQTQASLDQLLANADTRQKDYAALAGDAIAAQQAGNQRAAQASADVLGAALNPLVASRVDAAMQPANAMQYQQASQGAWADRLGQQSQRDFFERAKGIQSITQQAFNEGQRRQLAASLQDIAARQAANQQQRADLTRQYAQEDYALAQAFGQAQQDAAQQAFENNLATYNAETDRYQAVNGSGGGGGGSGGGSALSKDQLKAVNEVQKQVAARVAKIGTVRSTEGSGDQKVTNYWTNETVFGKGGGPWREVFKLLTAGNVGVGAGKAALLASQWYPGSITRSTPQKLVAMFNRLGVPPGVQKQIMMNNGFSVEKVNLALRGQSQMGPAVPAGIMTPAKWVKKLAGKKIKARGYTWKLSSYRDGSYVFKADNGRTVFLRGTGTTSPVSLLRSYTGRV